MCDCYTSNSVSVLIYGSPTSKITTNRGLKQGDPIAPFLFIDVVEGLAGLIRKVEENICFRGFLINNAITISLLQLTYDTMIFCEAKSPTYVALVREKYGIRCSHGFKSQQS